MREGAGATVDDGGGGLAVVVVDVPGGSVLVVWSVGRDLGSVGLWVTVGG